MAARPSVNRPEAQFNVDSRPCCGVRNVSVNPNDSR
jgi:hypothetical protein